MKKLIMLLIMLAGTILVQGCDKEELPIDPSEQVNPNRMEEQEQTYGKMFEQVMQESSDWYDAYKTQSEILQELSN